MLSQRVVLKLRELIISIKYFLHRLRHSRGDGFPSLSLTVSGRRGRAIDGPAPAKPVRPPRSGRLRGGPPDVARCQLPGNLRDARPPMRGRQPACNNAIPQPWPGTRSPLSREGSRPSIPQLKSENRIDPDLTRNIFEKKGIENTSASYIKHETTRMQCF